MILYVCVLSYVDDYINNGRRDEEALYEEDDQDDIHNTRQFVPAIDMISWNELWLSKFCLDKGLGREAQDDLREWMLLVSCCLVFSYLLR